MDQDSTVNSVLRDLKFKGIIKEEDTDYVQMIIGGVWTSGWEYYRRSMLNHNKKKINYYDQDGELLHTFGSIEEAARELGMGRSTIDGILYGRYKGRRITGHYFRYAENGDDKS